ncbi:MAG TPA: PDZ domain-containing protein, partial [bacterium]|nr:PDZ domain-containing protein [bacterium]
GIGFAIPINLAKQALEQLRSKGKVSRGWLGLTVKDISEAEAKLLGVDVRAGVVVTDLVPQGPSQIAGLNVGDVVARVNDEPVTNAQTMPSLIAKYLPGTAVTLQIIRQGKPETIQTVLGDLDDPNKTFVYPATTSIAPVLPKDIIGIDVRDIEKADKLGNKSGVLITNIHKDSAAFNLGLLRSDVITKINDSAIGNVDGFRKMIDKVARGEPLTFTVWRSGQERSFTLQK